MRILKRIKALYKECKSYKVPFIKGLYFNRKGYSVRDCACYCLNLKNYKQYLSNRESYIPRKYNCFKEVSDNKFVFSEIVGKYIRVPKNYMFIKNGIIFTIDSFETRIVPIKEFYEFLKEQCEKSVGLVIKVYNGADGRDVYLVTCKDDIVYINDKEINISDLESLIKSFNSTDVYLVQEKLQQGQFANDLFDKTTNTLRIVTKRKDNSIEHEVIGARFRIGNNASYPVDNFAKGGLACEIDVETGIMKRMTTWNSIKNGKRVFMDSHPDTNKKISGIIIPKWDSIKQQIIDLTKKMPFFDFVAWDIVLLDNNEIALIETNMKTSLDFFQSFGPMRNTKMGEAVTKAVKNL